MRAFFDGWSHGACACAMAPAIKFFQRRKIGMPRLAGRPHIFHGVTEDFKMQD